MGNGDCYANECPKQRDLFAREQQVSSFILQPESLKSFAFFSHHYKMNQLVQLGGLPCRGYVILSKQV